jgi:hypothetical protein
VHPAALNRTVWGSSSWLGTHALWDDCESPPRWVPCWACSPKGEEARSLSSLRSGEANSRTNTSATIVVVDVLFTNKGKQRCSSVFHSGTRATTTLAGVSLILAGDGPSRPSSRPGWVQQDVVPAGHDDVGDFNCFCKRVLRRLAIPAVRQDLRIRDMFTSRDGITGKQDRACGL